MELSAANLFLVLSGRELPTAELVSKLEMIPEVSKDSRGLAVCVSDCTTRLKGVDLLRPRCHRFWIRLPKVHTAYREMAKTLSNALDWNVEFRWAAPCEGASLPPRLPPLWNARRKRQGSNINTFMLAFDSLLSFGIVYAVQTAPQLKAWHAYLATCVSLMVAMCLLYRYSDWLRGTARYDRIDQPVLSAKTLVLFWYGLGGPAVPYSALIVGILAVVMAGLMLFLRRRAHRAADTRNGEIDWAWLAAQLTRDASAFTPDKKCCLACGHSLHGTDTCICPECGTRNYYLVDRADARTLAIENGAILNE